MMASLARLFGWKAGRACQSEGIEGILEKAEKRGYFL